MFLYRVVTAFVAVHFCTVTNASDTCEVIKINTCMSQRVLHKYTQTPIIIPAGPNPGDGNNTYRGQSKALTGKRQYISSLRTGKTKRCKNLMKPFMCAALLPSCEERSPEPVRPCRDFCLKTKAECQQNFADLGLDWPPELDCSLFPIFLENRRCMSGLMFERVPWAASESGIEVRVACRYVFNPSDEPRWMIHDIPVDEYSDRIRTEQTDSQTTTLIIDNFVDSLDRGNYTCVSGNRAVYQFTRQINLDNIFRDETMPPETETTSPVEGDIRLVDGQYSKPHSGLIQYYKDGQWGYLCEPLVWDETNGDVVCRQLGYIGSFFIATLGRMFGQGDGVVYPSASECTGQESKLADCPDDPWDLRQGCSHLSDLGLVCDTGLRETDIRLVGKSKPNEGVLEVFYNGEWGTVCSEGWDVRDAEVACRQLGYHGPKKIDSTVIFFDYDNRDRTSPITLSNIECTGNEDSIFDCPKSNWYTIDSCSHYRDVILGCTKEDADIVFGDLNFYETVTGESLSLQCSTQNVQLYLDAEEPPVWTLPSGEKMSGDTKVGNVRIYQFGGTSAISIEDFTDEQNAGQYTCSVTGFSKTVTLTREIVSMELPCAEGEFNCGKRCVPRRFLCDKEEDCANGSDEDEEMCSEFETLPQCPVGSVACQLDGDQCIALSAVCDGVLDCEHGGDESGCETFNSTCIGDTLPCPTGNKCIPLSAMCDGKPDCDGGADETACEQLLPFPSECGGGNMPCGPGGPCVPISAVCNGIPDCPSGIDESYCPNSTLPFPSECGGGNMPCGPGGPCVPISAVCNGIPDCPSGIDESYCPNSTLPFPPECGDGNVPCGPGGPCVPISALCNGIPDCSSGIDESHCPNVNSCRPITIPECTVGLGYTETLSNFQIGLSESDIAVLFSTMSVLFGGPCGTFFRPFMCATFLPPCGQTFRPPCREMCQLAIRKCLEASEGALIAEDLMPPGDLGNEQTCDALPSQDTEMCYVVKEVSIGSEVASGSEDGESRYIDCHYNLVPGYQPQWTTPDGSQVKTGDKRNVKAIYISDIVTRLQIDDYHSSRHGGRYTCSGQEYSDSVEL